MNLLFGPGDTDFARWVFIVRADILIFLVATLSVVAQAIGGANSARLRPSRFDVLSAIILTTIAAALRFGVAESNLSELGGIGYSRILIGYRGHFGAAQLYSPVYVLTRRDLATALLLNRTVSTLSVPLVYALCRRLAPDLRALAPIAAALVALQPLLVLLSATDALPNVSTFLAAASYLLLVLAVDDGPQRLRTTAALGAAAGLALLTQVRYENLLLVLPAAIYLVRARPRPLRLFAPALVLFTLLFAAYVMEALLAGSSFQNPVALGDLSADAVREAAFNPIFSAGPLLLGTIAAVVAPRSRIRLLAPLPFLAVVPLMMLAGPPGPHFARTYANLLLLLCLVAAYGLALLWPSPWRAMRIAAGGAVLWMAVLPILFWPILRQRNLEIAEHDFVRAALTSLPPGVDRVIVPDDEVLSRVTQSTIELVTKYRMIALGAGVRGIDLVGMTQFLEHPEQVDCARDNCLFLLGAPCAGVQHYWFAADGCAKVMASAGPPIREERVVAGSFLDCGTYRGEERQHFCEPFRKPRLLGLYRLPSVPRTESGAGRD